jgi:transcriptional regulator with XRE-family HTH domain
MSFTVYLQDELARRRGRNRRYSIRAFAQALGTDHSSLSQVLRGRRRLTDAAAGRYARALGLDDGQASLLIELSAFDRCLLAAIRQTGATSTPALARAVSATVDEVNVSLQRLLRLSMLDMRGGRWLVSEETTV